MLSLSVVTRLHNVKLGKKITRMSHDSQGLAGLKVVIQVIVCDK